MQIPFLTRSELALAYRIDRKTLEQVFNILFLLIFTNIICYGQINPTPLPKTSASRWDTLSLSALKQHVLANHKTPHTPYSFVNKDQQKLFINNHNSNIIVIQILNTEGKRELFALEFYDEKGGLLSVLHVDSLNPYLKNPDYKLITKGGIDWEEDQEIDTLPLPKVPGRMKAYLYHTDKLIIHFGNDSSKIALQFVLIGFSEGRKIIGWEQTSYFFDNKGNCLTSICNNIGLGEPMWDDNSNLLFLNSGGNTADGSPYFLPQSIAVYDLIQRRIVYNYSAVSGTAVTGFSRLMVNGRFVYTGAEDDYRNPQKRRYLVFHPDVRTIKCYDIMNENKVNSHFKAQLMEGKLRDINPTFTQKF